MISVIVPVYNTSEYLNTCIESLVNQTYEDIEIILVNDGSTDESPKICDNWAAKDSRIRVIHKENGGLVSSWKCGAESALGEYLTFVDSDDWVDANMLEELWSKTSGVETEIVASDYIIERPNGQEYVYQSLRPGVYERKEIENSVIPFIMGMEHRPVTISRCMKVISRKLILDNMKYSTDDLRMAEDSTIMVPALMDCTRLVIMDHKAYYHYLYIPDSMAHKYDKTMYANILKVYDICEQILNDKLLVDGRMDEKDDYYTKLHASLDRELVLWLLLCVKNEARGNRESASKNIRMINAEQRDLIRRSHVKLKDKSNILVYAALKYPNALVLKALDLAMKIYYR